MYEAVKKTRAQSARPHRGHGLDHDVAVAMMGTDIAPNDRIAERVFCAGLMHSIDHYVAEEDEVGAALDRYLDTVSNYFEPQELVEIKEAVLRHMEFKNRDMDTRKPTQRTLMDADKLVNMDPLVVVRSGQFHPEIPAIELEYIGTSNGQRYANPASTYPKPCSVLDDLRGCVEWSEPGWIHYPKAQELADERAGFIKDYIRKAEEAFSFLCLSGVDL